jgi:hypothetical protein
MIMVLGPKKAPVKKKAAEKVEKPAVAKPPGKAPAASQ